MILDGRFRHRPLVRGACFVLMASFLFAMMGGVIKYVSPFLSVEMIVFFRNFFGLLALTPWLWRIGRKGLVTQRLPLHGVRTLSGLAAMYCFFYVLGALNLGEAIVLNFTAPLFVPLIACLWLGERLHVRVKTAVGIGFLGVLLLLKPTSGVLSLVALIGLISGLCAAVAMVSMRDMARTEPPDRMVFYFSGLGTVLSSFPLLWSWTWPDWVQWAALVAIGVLANAGQMCLARGYGYAPAGQIGAFSYSSVVFGAFLGWAVWGETIDDMAVGGALLIGMAGMLVLSVNPPSNRENGFLGISR